MKITQRRFILSDLTAKEKLVSAIYQAVNKFECETGAEVSNIHLDRVDADETGRLARTSKIHKISLEIK